MQRNEQGFGIVAAAMVVLVIAVVGVIGWMVYRQQSPATMTNTVAVSGQSSSVAPKPGYKIYENDQLSIQYPEAWKVRDNPVIPDWHYIDSPDFKAPEMDAMGASAQAGYSLDINVAAKEPGESLESLMQSAKEGQSAVGGSYRAAKIGGKDGIVSSQKTHGTYLWAKVFSADKSYYFRLNAVDEQKQEAVTLFDTFLNSVVIK